MAEESLNEQERRKHFRIDMEKELVDIQWTDDKGNLIKKKIACLDFSRGGLKLDCDQSIPVKTEVVIIFQSADPRNQRLNGKVLRCLKQDNGWFEIGLSL